MLANKDQEIIVFKKLNQKDITITPFETYKEWNIITNNSASFGITMKKGTYRSYIGLDCKLDKETIDEQHLNYIGIKRLFYDRDMYNPNKTIGSCGEFEQTRELNGDMKIISIPQQTFGERIKPGSVILYQGNSLNTYYDDANGNLYHTLYSNNLVPYNNLISYINFNELYYLKSDILYSGSIIDNWNFINTITTNNVYSVDGIYGRGISLTSTSSYIQLQHNDDLNFTNYDDYSISFWINIPATHSIGDFDIISKYGNNIFSAYPYRIQLNQNNKISFLISDGKDIKYLTGSLTLTSSLSITSSFTDMYHHIVCRKSGSNMSLFENGVLSATDMINSSSRIHNSSDIFIGTTGQFKNYLSASIDEVRIYKRALTDTEIGNLYFTKNNSARVGNVFYEHGKIVLTAPKELFLPSGSYNFETNTLDINFNSQSIDLNFEFLYSDPYLYDDFTLFFKSQHTIYEREIICTIRDTEFNYTLNDSIRQTENPKDDRMKWFVNEPSQSFSPYITTIGLYNDYQQLLAVAKLARPIRSQKNSDLTFCIRLDM